MEAQVALLCFAVTFLQLSPSCAAACRDGQAHFLVEPSSVTAALNSTATFHFIAIGTDSTWKINERFYNDDQYKNTVNVVDNHNGENCTLESTLTVSATADFNNSEIECIIGNSNGTNHRLVKLIVATFDVEKVTADATTAPNSITITCSFVKGSPALGSLIMLTSLEGNKEELIKIATRKSKEAPTASVLFSNLQSGRYRVSAFDVKHNGHVNLSQPFYFTLNITVTEMELNQLKNSEPTTSTKAQEALNITITEKSYLIPAIVGATAGCVGCCVIGQVFIIIWMWHKLKVKSKAGLTKDCVEHIPIIVKEPAYEELKPMIRASPNMEQIYEEVPKAGLKEMDHISPTPCPAYAASHPRRRSITVI